MLKHQEPCTKNNRPLLWAHDAKREAILIYRPDCKTWGCETCRERRLRYWRAVIAEGVNVAAAAGSEFTFVTMTMHENVRGFEASRRLWPKVWQKTRLRWYRANGNKPLYVMLPEKHADDTLHMHMITDSALPERWYKDTVRACGGGYIADCEPVNSAGLAAWYVTKYVTKTWRVDAWPIHLRRVRTSQNWPKLPPQDVITSFDEISWSIVGSGARAHISRLIADGVKLIDIGSGEILEHWQW
jgi:hypothetical protein